MENILKIANENQKKAWNVVNDSKVIEVWKSIGAEINLVGSLKTGLLMKHRDIDFHIYTDEMDISKSFEAMSKLANVEGIKKIEFTNLLDCEDNCLEWHAWYEDDEHNLWQLDMMHILKGSRYDGYFENVADRIASTITQEQRETVLVLKYETPDDIKIAGIKYYKAVMQAGIKNYQEFTKWCADNSGDGIIEWMP